MITNELFARQYGFKGHTSAPFCPEYMVEFKCHREDEYLIDGHEAGDLIPPLACSFSKVNPNLLAVADEEGGILIVDTLKTRSSSTLHDWLSHSNAVFDIDWAWHEQQLATAGGDGTIVFWDVATEKKVGTFKGHGSSVKTVCYMPEEHDIIASGGRDGSVILWDRRVNRRNDYSLPVSVICDSHELDTNAHYHAIGRKKRVGAAAEGRRSSSHRYCNHEASSQSVTSVVFQDSVNLCSAGNADGSVKVWDMRKIHSISKSKSGPLTKHVFSAPMTSPRSHGVSNICVDSTRTRLFVSSLDSVIYQYDFASWSKEPVMKYSGHKVSTFYIKQSISPDDKYLMSGSSCGSAYIWPIPRTVPASCRQPIKAVVEMRGHISEVTAVAWCPADLCRAVTVSDDNSMWVWRMDPGVMENYEEYMTGGGTIVGTSQWLVLPEVLPPPSKISLTPRKGTTVPPSPVKLSPAMKLGISSLRRTPSSAIGPSSSRLISPSITSFFSQSAQPKRSKSYFAPSPRKLIITPKKASFSGGVGTSDDLLAGKVAGKVVPSVSGVKRKLCVDMGGADEQQPLSQIRKIAVDEDGLCIGLPGIGPPLDNEPLSIDDQKPAGNLATTKLCDKRKAGEGNLKGIKSVAAIKSVTAATSSSSKPACLAESLSKNCDKPAVHEETGSSGENAPVECCKNPSAESSRNVLSCIVLNPEDGSATDNRNSLCKTPTSAKLDHETKLEASTVSGSRYSENSLVFSSPTINLPNSVLDPPIFSPLRGNIMDKTKPKTPDWLTQLRLSKQQSAEKTPKGKISGSPSIGRKKTPGKKK